MKGSINLALTKVLKGKYSFDYYDKYYKIHSQFPYKEPLNEHFISHNILLFKRERNHTICQTNTEIRFSEVPFLSPMSSAFKFYGKPYQYSVYKLNNLILSIVAYNNNISAERNKTVLYFINNELMLGEYIFYDITEKKYHEIFLQYLYKKYLHNEAGTAEVIYIEDHNKNLLCVNWNGFDLSLKYLFSNVYDYMDDFKSYYNTTWKFNVEKENSGSAEFMDIPGVFE